LERGACLTRLENSRYRAGDTRDWLKIKPPEVRARHRTWPARYAAAAFNQPHPDRAAA